MSRPGYQSDAGLRSEIVFLEHLRAAGLPTLSPVRTRGGEAYTVVDENRCLLFEWIPGRSGRRSFNARKARAFGELAGRVHAASAAFRPPRGFARQTLDPDTLAGQATGFPRELIRSRLDADSLAVVDRAIELVRPAWDRASDRGLAHGDLHLANTLWVRGRPHLIDFDDMGWAPFAYDLAVAHVECREHPDGDALWSELLGAYASVRPVPDGVETNLDDFVAARRVFIVMWLTGNRDHPAFAGTGKYVTAELGALRRLS